MKLYSKILGEGPQILILHGLLGMGDNWLTIGRRLSEQYRVHLLDLRNHGQSPQSSEFSYEDMAGDVAEYMQDRKISAATVIGHSMGGKAAMVLALAHPELVENLVVVDIAPKSYDNTFFLKILDALSAVDLKLFYSRKNIEAQLKPDIPETSTRLFLLKNLSRDHGKRTFYWKANLAGIRAALDTIISFSSETMPFMGSALFIRGGNSNYIHDEDMSEIQSLFPYARLETVAGAAHWVHAEQPEAFYQVLSIFLAEHII